MGVYRLVARWADVDVNGHLRHSAYADYCTHARMQLLEETGLSGSLLKKLGIMPVLFREELVYKKELVLGEEALVSTALYTARRDGSRWGIAHQINKLDGSLACTVHVDGAWIDLRTRKLGALPESYAALLLGLRKVAEFAWME